MDLPNINVNLLETPTLDKVQAKALDHPPRILLLYGSNRDRSYSRLAVQEAGRILEYFGAEVSIFHPKGLRTTTNLHHGQCLALSGTNCTSCQRNPVNLGF